MKIVVLDGYTLNPGDLSWEPLLSLGECVIHPRTTSSEIVTRSADADMVLTNKTPLSRETLEQLPRLKYIGVIATGFNIVDVACASEHHITVTNVPTYGTSSVAQMVFAHLFNLTQHVGHHANTVRSGKWSGSADFCYWDFPLIELSGLVMGIAGFGRIGEQTARIAQSFGMQIIATNRSRPNTTLKDVAFVPIDVLFEQSDVISLHCPLTPETRLLVNADRLQLMRPGALLINTSRGGLIDEAALADALNGGKIAGAGLDVLSTEPPDPANPLLNARNCYITPHIAWATKAARERLLKAVVENIRVFLEGRPQHVVTS